MMTMMMTTNYRDRRTLFFLFGILSYFIQFYQWCTQNRIGLTFASSDFWSAARINVFREQLRGPTGRRNVWQGARSRWPLAESDSNCGQFDVLLIHRVLSILIDYNNIRCLLYFPCNFLTQQLYFSFELCPFVDGVVWHKNIFKGCVPLNAREHIIVCLCLTFDKQR